MLHGEYAEYLICKSLADGFNFCEVEYNGLESTLCVPILVLLVIGK